MVSTAEDQMQLAVANIINKVAAGAEAATEFIVAETPEVIQQLLMWNIVWSLFCFILGCCLLLSILPIYKFLIKPWKIKEESDRCGDVFFPFMIGAMVYLIPMCVGLVMINLDWLKIWIAPKVWLLEYASQLVK